VLRYRRIRFVNRVRRRRRAGNFLVVRDGAVENGPLHVIYRTQYDYLDVMGGSITLKSKYL
jgi:hypothetical protein